MVLHSSQTAWVYSVFNLSDRGLCVNARRIRILFKWCLKSSSGEHRTWAAFASLPLLLQPVLTAAPSLVWCCSGGYLSPNHPVEGLCSDFLQCVRAGKIFLVLKPGNLVLLWTTLPPLVDIKHLVGGFCAMALVMKETLEQENVRRNIGFYHK